MKKAFKRLRSQQGMSGILVTLLLVIVGVGLVAGVNAYMQGASTDVQTAADTAIAKAISETGTAQ